MGIWSDTDWLAAVGSRRMDVTPWNPDDLTPNGLDLRISHLLVDGVTHKKGTVEVPPMTRFVVGTVETMRMPTDAVGSLWIRSSYARRGVLASFGKVDAGFHGNLTIGAFHTGAEPLQVPVGDRFCQIVMENLQSPIQKAYNERSGNYQNQTGITLG